MAKINPQILSSDALEDFGEEEKVLDMMSTGQSSTQLLRHMQVVGVREFDYEEIITRGRDADGNVVDFMNPGRSPAYEAFMQEGVIINIAETTDEKQPPVVYVACNGDERWFPRGINIKVQRFFVEILAQSNQKDFETRKVNASEDNDNERPATIKRTQGTPFSVIRDTNPDVKLCRKWLMRVTKQSR